MKTSEAGDIKIVGLSVVTGAERAHKSAPSAQQAPIPDGDISERRAIHVPFICWAPSCAAGRVPIEIVALDKALVDYWHSLIQPVIDRDLTRADHGWRWLRIWAATNFFGALQRPRGFAACVTTPRGDKVPCAMVQLVTRYPALDDRQAECVFVWFLADAPRAALAPLLPDGMVPKMLGTIALDIAVTLSFRDQLTGRTGLHADPGGGDTLMKWYLSKGMTNLAAAAPRPSICRANDGRYFYHTPDSALAASNKLDPFREIGG